MGHITRTLAAKLQRCPASFRTRIYRSLGDITFTLYHAARTSSYFVSFLFHALFTFSNWKWKLEGYGVVSREKEREKERRKIISLKKRIFRINISMVERRNVREKRDWWIHYSSDTDDIWRIFIQLLLIFLWGRLVLSSPVPLSTSLAAFFHARTSPRPIKYAELSRIIVARNAGYNNSNVKFYPRPRVKSKALERNVYSNSLNSPQRIRSARVREKGSEENQLEKKWVASRAGTRPTRSHIYASKRGAWPPSLNLSKCLSARFARFHLEVAASPSVYRHLAISNPANPRNANDRWTTGDRDKTACRNENTRPIIASATANLTIRLYPPFHQECLSFPLDRDRSLRPSFQIEVSNIR